jgi:inhibitor of cysteine peptidase
MVQQEVKKKTRIYGTVAILSAMILVTLIFFFGSTPSFTPNLSEVSPMQSFASYDELKNYLLSNQGTVANYSGGPLDAQFFGSRSAAAAPGTTDQGTNVNSYSTTNIQVAGVDEPDIVKTDGKYIYTVSNDFSNWQNRVYIVKADPQDPRVIAKITLDNNTYLAGMFLSQDGNRLVIIGSQYQIYAYDVNVVPSEAVIYPYRSAVKTFINVYDVSDKAYPILARNLTLSGSYFNSRMIGSYVYIITSESAYVLQNGDVPLPTVYLETGATDIAPSNIYYADKAYYGETGYNYFTYTSFIGLNILDNEQEPTNMTVLMGGASTMYVSVGNIYMTYPTWNNEQGEYTSIYRISVAQDKFTFEAKGSVAGYVLNQYSMDEYNGYFRMATTSQTNSTQNNVFVLNMNLTTVGRLENLAVTERIYSARFIGDKAYLVTFRQIDPFFVLDLSNPTEPKVAGELKIPGYSSYLHPYDEDHIIGLGIENNTLKLSLFDVTNVNSPTEMAKYIIQGDYTYSEALYDPKAFLFDQAKELLAIPVSIVQYGVITGEPKTINGTTIDAGTVFSTQAYWQGAQVFKLTLTGGFEFRGGITHQDNSTIQQGYWYGDYSKNVNRALYIDNTLGDTLYTVSYAKVKLNNLTDLSEIAEIELS